MVATLLGELVHALVFWIHHGTDGNVLQKTPPEKMHAETCADSLSGSVL